jgi:hypothetical protein
VHGEYDKHQHDNHKSQNRQGNHQQDKNNNHQHGGLRGDERHDERHDVVDVGHGDFWLLSARSKVAPPLHIALMDWWPGPAVPRQVYGNAWVSVAGPSRD